MTVMADTLSTADWFTSSYSNNQGGECVEGARLGPEWFTSSYSNDQGGDCVEGARLGPGSDWFTSSHSNDQGGNCVEGAVLADGGMAVRDSKDPHGPALVFSATAWQAFTSAVRSGELPTA